MSYLSTSEAYDAISIAVSNDMTGYCCEKQLGQMLAWIGNALNEDDLRERRYRVYELFDDAEQSDIDELADHLSTAHANSAPPDVCDCHKEAD